VATHSGAGQLFGAGYDARPDWRRDYHGMTDEPAGHRHIARYQRAAREAALLGETRQLRATIARLRATSRVTGT
jgi:hypothetical protein